MVEQKFFTKVKLGGVEFKISGELVGKNIKIQKKLGLYNKFKVIIERPGFPAQQFYYYAPNDVLTLNKEEALTALAQIFENAIAGSMPYDEFEMCCGYLSSKINHKLYRNCKSIFKKVTKLGLDQERMDKILDKLAEEKGIECVGDFLAK